MIDGDPARLVGPAFYEQNGDDQIPLACVLVVIALDPGEGDSKSTYVMTDSVEPLVTHYGMATLALRRLSRQLNDALDELGEDEE